MWDLAVLGVVPGIRIAAPRDEATLREELHEAVGWAGGPTVLRYPKTPLPEPVPAVRRVGELDVLREPAGPGPVADVLLVSVGAMAGEVLEVAERVAAHGITATVVDPRWVTPVAPELVELARRHRLVVTCEDGNRAAGVGARLSQALRDADLDVPARDVGIPARFLAHGKVAEVRAEVGLTGQDIARSVVEWVARLDGGLPSPVDPTDQPAEP
jgi:1-deoxy-D-xylulose-5-phosphate synthase